MAHLRLFAVLSLSVVALLFTHLSRWDSNPATLGLRGSAIEMMQLPPDDREAQGPHGGAGLVESTTRDLETSQPHQE